MALVLFGVGLGVRLAGSEGGGADTRRRLASTLMTGAAGVAGFATQVLLSPSRPDSTDGFNRSLLAGGAVALAVVVAGYLLARSSVGQLGAAAAAVWTLLAALVVADVQSSRPFGLGLVALGVAWSGLAWSGRGRGGLRGGVGWGGRVRDGLGRARLAWGGPVGEPRVGLGISVTLALTGAQVAMFGPDQVHYLGHALTALVATGCFAAYVRLRDWLVLAGGVVGATLAVPEFLYDVTDGSLGAAGVLLAAGVTLLVASLAGLHLRRDRLTQPTGPDLSTR
jgi:uncharacterized membrane protein (UPF0136 family)